MSRTAAPFAPVVTRGSTWEDEILYIDENGADYDLTGFTARMQVRTLAGQYGTTTTTTLVLELTTANGRLVIDTPAGGTVPNRIKILVSAADTALLNASNVKKIKHAYSLELVRATPLPEYVLPLVEGKIAVLGEVTR